MLKIRHWRQAPESRSSPALERADAAIFLFSRIPGLLNSAVAAGEKTLLTEAAEVLQTNDFGTAGMTYWAAQMMQKGLAFRARPLIHGVMTSCPS